MCLHTKRIFPRKAKEDIICYKTLVYSEWSDDMYTPFRNACVTTENKIIGFEQKPADKLVWWSRRGEINEGAIHTYSKKEHLFGCAHIIYDDNGFPCDIANWGRNRIFVCKIPKGTFYWEGKYGDYASQKIVYLKEIIPNEDKDFLSYLHNCKAIVTQSNCNGKQPNCNASGKQQKKKKKRKAKVKKKAKTK